MMNTYTKSWHFTILNKDLVFFFNLGVLYCLLVSMENKNKIMLCWRIAWLLLVKVSSQCERCLNIGP